MKILTLTMNPCIDRTLWVENFDSPPLYTEMISGGKGLNVARVLTELGEDCIAVAPCGGESGDLFASLARSEGINLSCVPVSGKVRTIDTYVRKGDYAQRVVRENGMNLSDAELSLIKSTVLSLLGECAVLAICGSASCTGGARLIHELIGEAKKMGVRTLLDSNGEALRLGADALPDVLKINEKELEQLVGASDDPLHSEALTLTMQKGIGRIILTLGERGCAQYLYEQTSFCPAPKIDCINAVGSGDCFTAAWLHAQVRGFSDDGALMLANAAGSLNAMQFPAARIKKEELERFIGFRWC